MIQLNNMYVFISVVEFNGFTEAAKKLNITSAAVSKNIKQLEIELGVTLFHRSTRKVALTENGKVLFEMAKNVLSGVDEIKNYAAVLQQESIGTLRISCPVSIGVQILLPVINEYLTEYPQVSVELDLQDRKFINLEKDNIDILFGRTHSSIIGQEKDLIGVKLFETENVLCASTNYIKKHGKPKNIHDLDKHNYIYHKDRIPDRFVELCNRENVTLKSSLMVNTTEALIQCIKLDIGIGMIPHCLVKNTIPYCLVKHSIDKHEIVVLDHLYKEEPMQVHMFFRKTRFKENKIAHFKEFILKKYNYFKK